MKYTVNSSDLTSVADAIRTKGETSASLSFPDGFVDAIDAIDTGGGSTLISKTITANGTYNASSDNADGYSSVTANVKPQYVTGTFTGTTTGAAIDLTIPYTGSGYPIALMIYPSTGTYKAGSDIYSLAQKNAIMMLSMCKIDISSTPTYSDNTADANKGTITGIYKYSDSDATSTNANRALNEALYRDSDAAASLGSAARFKNNTTLSVYIASTTYGFADGIEYTYQVLYSE